TTTTQGGKQAKRLRDSTILTKNNVPHKFEAICYTYRLDIYSKEMMLNVNANQNFSTNGFFHLL
ncbi:MAG: hypothetical protein KBB67_04730, partial [Syntrophorhabdus sp.]|nr:hypothetical protein [Syntrophorhabdus sp.]